MLCKVEELRREMESRLDSQRRHMVQKESQLKSEVEELKVNKMTTITLLTSLVLVLEAGLRLGVFLNWFCLISCWANWIFDNAHSRLSQHCNSTIITEKMQLLPFYALLVTPRVTSCSLITSSLIFNCIKVVF